MTLLCIGLSHRTTPVGLREKLYMTEPEIYPALAKLRTSARESVIISTCNRLEVYAHVDDAAVAQDEIISFLGEHHAQPPQALRPHLYILQDDSAAAHLMRVASGLDSMVLGESQILGQVGDALETARTAGTVNTALDRLFTAALHTGKRARTETAIGDYSISVSHSAALLIRELTNGSAPDVLLVGAGEMAALAAQALVSRGISGFRIINRTLEHAQELAETTGAEVLEWHRLSESLRAADVVLTATAAPHTIIYADDVEHLLEERKGKPLTFVDIAVPRNVEESVDALDGVTVYDIDDLHRVVDENLARREACIPQVTEIITEERTRFLEWFNSRDVTPVISDLRRKVRMVVDDELQAAMSRLEHLDERDRAIIERMAHRIANKVLHDPTTSLRQHAASGNGDDVSQLVRDLFSLAPNGVKFDA